MATMGTVIDFLLMLSLGGLAGLVIALHLKLRQFSDEAGKVPALADDLTRAITASRHTMQELAKAAKTDGARLEDLVSQAERTRQEMVYVLDRAEKVLTQFDRQMENQPVPQPRRLAAQGSMPQAQQQEAATQNRETSWQAAPEPSRPPESKPEEVSQQPQQNEKAAIMPGRYQSRLGVDQNGRPRPYKPASFQSGAAAYGASASQEEVKESSSSTEAENELRRALENAI